MLRLAQKSALARASWTRSVLARHASTTSEDSSTLGPSRLVDRAATMFYHPRVLLDAASAIKAKRDPGKRFCARTVTELAAHPLVEDRWDAIRDLLPLVPEDSGVGTAFQPSHAAAVALLPSVAVEYRPAVFGLILLARYEDALFVSAKDLFAALEHFADKEARTQAIKNYLRQFITNMNKLQPQWERDALVARGTSIDSVRALAAEQLRAVDDYVLTAQLENPLVRGFLVGAYSATRCSAADAQRHWQWLVQHQGEVTVGPAIVEYALSAARDLDTLKRTFEEARPYFPSGKSDFPAQGFLVEQLARLGDVQEAERQVINPAYKNNGAWAVHVKKGSADGSTVLARKNMKRAQLLTDAGFDFESVVWMLSHNSPYFGLIHGFDPKRKASSKK